MGTLYVCTCLHLPSAQVRLHPIPPAMVRRRLRGWEGVASSSSEDASAAAAAGPAARFLNEERAAQGDSEWGAPVRAQAALDGTGKDTGPLAAAGAAAGPAQPSLSGLARPSLSDWSMSPSPRRGRSPRDDVVSKSSSRPPRRAAAGPAEPSDQRRAVAGPANAASRAVAGPADAARCAAAGPAEPRRAVVGPRLSHGKHRSVVAMAWLRTTSQEVHVQDEEGYEEEEEENEEEEEAGPPLPPWTGGTGGWPRRWHGG